MPGWLWLVVIVAVALLLIALLSSGRRRVVADGDAVVTGGSGAGAGFLLGVLFVIALLAILVIGMWQFDWFGVHSAIQTQAPVITTPGSSPILSSPSSSASPS